MLIAIDGAEPDPRRRHLVERVMSRAIRIETLDAARYSLLLLWRDYLRCVIDKAAFEATKHVITARIALLEAQERGTA